VTDSSDNPGGPNPSYLHNWPARPPDPHQVLYLPPVTDRYNRRPLETPAINQAQTEEPEGAVEAAQTASSEAPKEWEVRTMEILLPCTMRCGEGRWHSNGTTKFRKTFPSPQKPGRFKVYHVPSSEAKPGEDWGEIRDRPGPRAGLPLSEWDALAATTPPTIQWCDE
jgi:hypothetical protein